MLLNLTKLIHKYNLKITGAIHIGAHYGEEVPEYHKNGIEKIVLIEPAIEAFGVLVRKFGGARDIVLYNLACGANNGMAKLNVETANKGQSNSLLHFGTHAEQYPDIKFTNTQTVGVIPLDRLLLGPEYNFINVDVQGYEGEVFKGATETLKHIDYIYSEVNKDECYKGCIKVEELDVLLSDFTRVETGAWVNNSWSDALYIRKQP